MGKTLTIYCDGASRGNPGPGSYGYVVYEGDELIDRRGEPLGVVTNNVAEYQGLIQGLQRCADLGAEKVIVKSDSELMVRQLNGIYKVKTPHIRELFVQAQKILTKFKVAEIVHIRREENSLADALANEALDRKT